MSSQSVNLNHPDNRGDLLEHVAFSFIHGGFDPDSQSGGCSCDLCKNLRNKITEIRNAEADEYFKQRYGKGWEASELCKNTAELLMQDCHENGFSQPLVTGYNILVSAAQYLETGVTLIGNRTHDFFEK